MKLNGDRMSTIFTGCDFKKFAIVKNYKLYWYSKVFINMFPHFQARKLWVLLLTFINNFPPLSYSLRSLAIIEHNRSC